MSMYKQNRREFAKRLAAGAAAAALNPSAASGKEAIAGEGPVGTDGSPPSASPHVGQRLPPHRMTSGELSADARWFHETARAVPVAGASDVVVCGGGPAGVAAALAAARNGAKTRLLEVNGCLGGIWTAGALSLVLDLQNKKGILRLLQQRLEQRQAAHVRPGGSLVYDPESMKQLVEELLVDARVEIQLHTRVVGAVRDPANRLAAVVTESKSGREAWTGRVFIDCTGDGDLGALAGCKFDLGRPDNGATQPMSLMALLTGPPLDAVAQFVGGEAEQRQLGKAKANLLAEMRRAGVDPSYQDPTIFCIRDGFYAMMANHQYNALPTDAASVTAATLEARREVHRIVDALRASGGPWGNLRLVATAEQIGTREGRRIHGRYQVVAEDLKRGAAFDDAICHVRFGIDVHSTDSAKTKAIEAKPFASKPYDLPLRALIARDVDGLLMAGRCISGDFIAHSSYRVTGNAVPMGEAAGITAALAAAGNVTPHALPLREVAAQIARAE